MAGKKILVIFGATGKQGGSVATVILADEKMREAWTVRAVTRDTSKPSAQALEKLGAETVAADLNNASSLGPALKGADTVFAVTNYWETMKAAVEIAQGKAIADACKTASVSHLIWSALPDATKLTNGGLTHVEHFDSKAAVAEYIKELGIPHTLFMPGFFLSNIPGAVMRQSPPHNAWTFSLPFPSTTQIPVFDTEDDTGKFVKGIMLNKEKTLGKEILGATAYMTPDQMVQQFKEQFPMAGVNAMFVELSHDGYKEGLAKAGMPPVGQEELLENMRLMSEYGYYGGKSLDESLEILVDQPTTWKEYMLKAKAFEGLQ